MTGEELYGLVYDAQADGWIGAPTVTWQNVLSSDQETWNRIARQASTRLRAVHDVPEPAPYEACIRPVPVTEERAGGAFSLTLTPPAGWRVVQVFPSGTPALDGHATCLLERVG